jgi:hypothetical protein
MRCTVKEYETPDVKPVTVHERAESARLVQMLASESSVLSPDLNNTFHDGDKQLLVIELILQLTTKEDTLGEPQTGATT